MVGSVPLLRMLVAAPLLASSLIHALPSGSQEYHHQASPLHRRDEPQQLVLADAESALGTDQSTVREPDLVEMMLADAQSKGMDLSQWGVKESDVADEGLEQFIRPTTKESVNLDDEAERLALLAEAAAEDTLAWIQPVVEDAEHAIDQGLDIAAPEPDKKMQPGSGWIWNVCGTRQEAVVLQEINVKPDPPIAGQNLTVYAKGTVNADIEEGTFADVVVKLGFIRLLSKRFDVCQLAEENDAELKCPVKAGEYEMTHTVELPREIPPARFNVHVSGKTQADVDLMCMDLSIDFSHH